MHTSTVRPYVYLFLTASLLLVSPGAGALAQTGTPSPPATVITSCVSKLSGVSRIVSSPTACHTTVENVVQWNQLGPQGQQGPQGTQGSTGQQGQQGPAGLQGVLSPNGFTTATSFNVANSFTVLPTPFYFDPSTPPTLSTDETTNDASTGNFFAVPAACTLSSLKVGGIATAPGFGGGYVAFDTFKVLSMAPTRAWDAP